jgi:hypothetical protein
MYAHHLTTTDILSLSAKATGEPRDAYLGMGDRKFRCIWQMLTHWQADSESHKAPTSPDHPKLTRIISTPIVHP